MEFKMVDDKPIIDQVQEMVCNAQEIVANREPMIENFKFQPSLVSCHHYGETIERC